MNIIYKRPADSIVLRIGESILCLLYSIIISDRLNCKVVGGPISMQCSEHNSKHYSIASLVRVTSVLICHQRAWIHFLVYKIVITELEFN